MRLPFTSVTRTVSASPESQKGESWRMVTFCFRHERGTRETKANKEPMIAVAQMNVILTEFSETRTVV